MNKLIDFKSLVDPPFTLTEHLRISWFYVLSSVYMHTNARTRLTALEQKLRNVRLK